MSSALDKDFSFYLSYHSNSVNKIIHVLCVWPIVFTAQIILQYTPSLTVYLPESFTSFLPSVVCYNINLFFTIKYAMYYAVVEQPGYAGIVAAILVVLGYLFSIFIVDSQPDVWKAATFIHIFCWTAQIYGHKVHEKRQPAFMDNIQQALMVAPLFVLMEVLYDLFGYKAKFIEEMQIIADKNIKQYRES